MKEEKNKEEQEELESGDSVTEFFNYDLGSLFTVVASLYTITSLRHNWAESNRASYGPR